MKSSNNSWNFFSHNFISSHIFLLEIAVCEADIYRMGVPEILQEFLEFLLSQPFIKSCFPVRKCRLRDRNLSYGNSWNLVSRDLLSSHVFLLEIAVCGTEICRMGIPEIVEQFLEFFLAQPLIKSCFPVRNCRLRERHLSYGSS